MERGSRVSLAVKEPPKSMTLGYLLNISDKIPLFSITWKDITLKKVQLPVSPSIVICVVGLTLPIKIYITQQYVTLRLFMRLQVTFPFSIQLLGSRCMIYPLSPILMEIHERAQS